MEKMNIKYYEIEYTDSNDDMQFWRCILGVRKPTAKEAETFWSEKGYRVTAVTEISQAEAYKDYAMNEYERRYDRKIFGTEKGTA